MNTLLRLHRLCRYDAASTLLVILATQAYSQVSLAPVQYGTYISQLSPRPPHYIHHFALEHFNESSGFANEGVVKIHQDRHGFLWILTEKSLFRYDGQNFRSYTHNKDDSTSLHKPFYDNLHEDRHGVLWIVGTYGLQRYDAERDCFQRISIRTSSNQLLTTRILSVHEDIHTEHLWLGIGKEIWLIHREQYFVMRRHVCFQNSTSDFHQAQRIVADSAGRLWIASSESSSIHIVDSRVSQSHTTFHLDSNNHACFLIHQDSLWTSSSRGIILWSIRQQKPLCIYPLSEYSTPRSPATGLPQIPFTSILVRDMLRDSKGRVWVATDQGIIVIYPQTQQMQRFQSDPFNPRSLSTNDITALYEDRSGCIWIGEGVYGLHKYTPLQYQFQLYRHIPYTTNSLSNNYIRGIAEDPDGNLWVGTQFGGLNHLNRRTGQWTRFYRDSVRSVSRLNITGNHIRSLCVDRYGILWVAVQGSSLCTLDTKHPERGFTALSFIPKSTSAEYIYEDRAGNIWISTPTHQFLMYKVSADRQRVEEIHRTTTIPPRAAYTQAMLEDRSGILWIGSPHGLVRYDPVHNTARSYSWQPDDSTALPNNFVTAITETRSGELWLATKGGGICRFNPNTETFTTINSSHGLPHDDCYAVIEDDNGRLWISTDNGIAVYEPHRRTIRCFGLEHGLQGKEYNRFAHYRSARTGEIFFGGVDGLNSFFPNDIHTNSVPPIPAFLAVLAPNGTTLTRNITLCGIQRVEIPPQTGVIIRCAALEFTLPHHNLFSWKLDGVDTAWSPASRNSSAIYSTLSPGEYTFRLRTANADNVWSPQEAVLTLVVLPAWWQTWYAIMGFILSGIAFVVLLVRTRVRHLKAQAQQLQALVEARTHALQQVNQELQSKNQLLLELNAEMHEIMGIVSHDLKNPLASIIGITEILQSAHEIALTQDMHHKLLSQIASASERMLHLIRNLLDINALEAGKIQPNFAMCSVNSTARVVVEEYSTKAAGKSLSLHFSEAHYDIVYADETMLYQVIANLVSNAIKYSPHNRNIWVRLTNPLPYNGHQALLLSVKDEGPGISVEDQQRLFKRFARLSARPTGGEDSTGLGLSIVKKMVELMNGRVWCESTLGYGAEFIVEFPLALPASERVVPPTQHRQLPTP